MAKPKDIRFPSASDLMDPSFVNSLTNRNGIADVEGVPLEFKTTCPVFEETGECKHGFKCRFLGGHVRKDNDGSLLLIQDEEKKARTAVSAKELNFMSPDTLKLLRSKKACYTLLCSTLSKYDPVFSSHSRCLFERNTGQY